MEPGLWPFKSKRSTPPTRANHPPTRANHPPARGQKARTYTSPGQRPRNKRSTSPARAKGPTYTSPGQRPISANFKISHVIISIIRFRALARHRRLSFKSSLIRSHSAITSLILKAGSMAACNRCSMKANSRQRLRSGLQLAAPGGKIPRLAGQLFCQQADKQFPVKPRSCAAVVSLGKVAGIR